MDLNPSKNLNNHILWRINRMRAGRILRKLFPKPIDIPNWWEQSTERFIFFDESKSPSYSLVRYFIKIFYCEKYYFIRNITIKIFILFK